VYRKILRQRDFTWAEHGEALMRRRKAWYYQREPRPGVSVIGDRLMELASGGRVISGDPGWYQFQRVLSVPARTGPGR
jgi:hypothetical protein